MRSQNRNLAGGFSSLCPQSIPAVVVVTTWQLPYIPIGYPTQVFYASKNRNDSSYYQQDNMLKWLGLIHTAAWRAYLIAQ